MYDLISLKINGTRHVGSILFFSGGGGEGLKGKDS